MRDFFRVISIFVAASFCISCSPRYHTSYATAESLCKEAPDKERCMEYELGLSNNNSGAGFAESLSKFNQTLQNDPQFQRAVMQNHGVDPATIERRILPLQQKQQRDARIAELMSSQSKTGSDLDQQIKILTLQRMLEQQDREEQLRLETQQVNDALLEKLNEPKLLPKSSMNCTSSAGYGGTVNTYCN